MLLPLPTAFAAGEASPIELAKHRLFWEVDFRSMPRQPLPTTQAAWQQLTGGPPATALWRLDAAGIATCAVSGATLSPSGGPLQARRIVGLCRGGDGDRWHRGAEFLDGGAARLLSSSTSIGNPGSGAWGLVLVMRLGRRPAANHTIAAKMTAGGAGWRIYREAGGDLVFRVTDAVDTSEARIAVDGDLAPHAYQFWIDRTSGEFGIETAYTVVEETYAPGDVVSAAPMFLGGEATIGTSAPFQVAYCAVLNADLRSLGTGWWRHGRIGTSMAYSRSGWQATIIEDDAVRGAQVAHVGTGQVAYVRDPDWEGYGLGAAVWPAITNRMYSSDMADWGSVAGTATPLAAESPSGDWSALQWVAASGGQIYLDAVTLAAAGAKAWSRVFARTVTGEAATLELQFWDASQTTLLSSSTSEIDGRWKHCTFASGWTVPAAADYFVVISTPVGVGVYLWGADCNQVSETAPLVWSTAISPATCGALDMRRTHAAAPGGAGRLIAEYSCGDATAAGDRYIADVSGVGDTNRHSMRVTAAQALATAVYDSGAVLRYSPSVPSVPPHNGRMVAELAWQAASPIGGSGTARARATLNGVAVDGTGSVFTASDTVTSTWLGQSRAMGDHLRGMLRRVRMFAAAL